MKLLRVTDELCCSAGLVVRVRARARARGKEVQRVKARVKEAQRVKARVLLAAAAAISDQGYLDLGLFDNHVDSVSLRPLPLIKFFGSFCSRMCSISNESITSIAIIHVLNECTRTVAWYQSDVGLQRHAYVRLT